MLQLEATDQEDLRFSVVDPHLIQPTFDDLLIERNLERGCADSPDDSQTLPAVDGSVRMEHCINLDWYMAPITDPMEYFYTDELNTPDTLEAIKLNKIIDTTAHQKQSNGNPFNFPTAAQPAVATPAKAISISESKPVNVNKSGRAHALINNSSALHCIQPAATMFAESLPAGGGDPAGCGGLLSPEHFGVEGIDMNEYDFLNDYQDAILHDMMRTDDDEHACDSHSIDNTSNSALPAEAATVSDHHNYALKLNIGHLLPQDGDVLQTPDIINTILQYDNSTEFVTFEADFLTSEQIKEELTYSPESDVLPHSPAAHTCTVDDESSMQSMASSSTAAPPVKVARTRRRKRDSDDEDYVPPSKARKTTKRLTVPLPIKKEDSDDEDYASASPAAAKELKRGRPAKLASARSSTSSECSKYREMRDKNNEASRRSRRKRRIQEINVEDECEILRMANVRLLAEVAELEKSVAVYRDNLMSLLLKKA